MPGQHTINSAPHFLCASSSYLPPSPFLWTFITFSSLFPSALFYSLIFFLTGCLCDLYFLLNWEYHFQHLWEKKGEVVISVSQMIQAPLLSSVWVVSMNGLFSWGDWYPAGGSINQVYLFQPLLQGGPPLQCRRRKNLWIITNVTHIAIRLHLSHIDNHYVSRPEG